MKLLMEEKNRARIRNVTSTQQVSELSSDSINAYDVSIGAKPSKRVRNAPKARLFPEKLHDVITNKEGDVLVSKSIQWDSHGRSFRVLDTRLFEKEVLHKLFKSTKMKSFVRQLNLYKFCRITEGFDSGSYYHPLFLRGRKDLCESLRRPKNVERSGGQVTDSCDSVPDFHHMPTVEQEFGFEGKEDHVMVIHHQSPIISHDTRSSESVCQTHTSIAPQNVSHCGNERMYQTHTPGYPYQTFYDSASMYRSHINGLNQHVYPSIAPQNGAQCSNESMFQTHTLGYPCQTFYDSASMYHSHNNGMNQHVYPSVAPQNGAQRNHSHASTDSYFNSHNANHTFPLTKTSPDLAIRHPQGAQVTNSIHSGNEYHSGPRYYDRSDSNDGMKMQRSYDHRYNCLSNSQYFQDIGNYPVGNYQYLSSDENVTCNVSHDHNLIPNMHRVDSLYCNDKSSYQSTSETVSNTDGPDFALEKVTKEIVGFPENERCDSGSLNGSNSSFVDNICRMGSFDDQNVFEGNYPVENCQYLSSDENVTCNVSRDHVRIPNMHRVDCPCCNDKSSYQPISETVSNTDGPDFTLEKVTKEIVGFPENERCDSGSLNGSNSSFVDNICRMGSFDNQNVFETF